jgi:hypothetical protein
VLRLACRCFVSTEIVTLCAYPSNMDIRDETVEEINEALSHIVDVLHKTRDSQKKHLWALVDELLDAKIARESK